MTTENYPHRKETDTAILFRPIKFRCWDYQLKRWATESDEDLKGCIGLVFDTNTCYLGEEGEELIRFEFQQFTGLLDRELNEIYEGDIVKCYHLNSEGTKVIVEEITAVQNVGCGYMPLIRHSNRYMEVIGNVHESAWLLPAEHPLSTPKPHSIA